MANETEPRRTHPPPSTPQERREELYQWALERALAHDVQTVVKARQHAKGVYGIAPGTAFVAEILKRAAEDARAKLRGETPQVSIRLPTPEIVPAGAIDMASIERTMRAAGVRMIEIMPDGKVQLQFFNP
jgi:hypothetical protein